MRRSGLPITEDTKWVVISWVWRWVRFLGFVVGAIVVHLDVLVGSVSNSFCTVGASLQIVT